MNKSNFKMKLFVCLTKAICYWCWWRKTEKFVKREIFSIYISYLHIFYFILVLVVSIFWHIQKIERKSFFNSYIVMALRLIQYFFFFIFFYLFYHQMMIYLFLVWMKCWEWHICKCLKTYWKREKNISNENVNNRWYCLTLLP